MGRQKPGQVSPELFQIAKIAQEKDKSEISNQLIQLLPVTPSRL